MKYKLQLIKEKRNQLAGFEPGKFKIPAIALTARPRRQAH